MKLAYQGLLCFAIFTANTAFAHTMKNFSVNEKSYSDYKTISMIIVNDGKPMDYEIIVDGQLLGSIGEKVPPRKDFKFEIELPTPENKISEYKICTRTLPSENIAKMTVCGRATLDRL